MNASDILAAVNAGEDKDWEFKGTYRWYSDGGYLCSREEVGRMLKLNYERYGEEAK